jgi:hypothetical protein
MECYLNRCGFDIVASDIQRDALRLCLDRGLRALQIDVLAPPTAPGLFDILYADGVLGHLTDAAERASFWRNTALYRPVFLLVSNDLSDDDCAPNWSVSGVEGASFYRPPRGHYAAHAETSGPWEALWSKVIRYTRSGRAQRRRELLVLRRPTDARTDET